MLLHRTSLLISLLLLSAVPAPAQSPTILHVSVVGNDGWSGAGATPNPSGSDGPLRTLSGARDAVRRLRAERPDQPVTVLVRGGLYTLAEPLVFSPDDSGSPQARVTYAGYPGETPVVSGGRRIDGWRPVEGEPGLWAAEVPEVKAGKWLFHQLIVDGHRRQRARSPNAGSYYVDGRISADRHARFHYRDGNVRPKWSGSRGVEFIALCRWQQYRLPITDVDPASRTVTLAGPRMPNGAEVAPRYWIENTRDALDAPGEWFLEALSGILYYRPMPREDMATAEVIAPVLEQLVVFDGDARTGRYVHDITLRGLLFRDADWSIGPEGYADMQAASEIPAAIVAHGARSCAIEQCVLTHLGQYAVALGKGSKENLLVGNEMTDLGAGGVKIGDEKSSAHPQLASATDPPEEPGTIANGRQNVNFPRSEAEAASGNVVTDNAIHDIGAVFASAVGVWIGQSSGNTVVHNEIYDTYYSGISVGWTWGWGRTMAQDNLIEQNHIHDIGRGLLSDMGCIYTLGAQPGTVLRNNLCHDVKRYEKPSPDSVPDAASRQGLLENQTG
jgi:hypothetical protein